MDIITLTGIHTEALIGVFDWERAQKCALTLDIQCQTDISQSSKTDNVLDALDYAKLTEIVCEFVSQTEFKLLETLADAIAKLILQTFPTQWIKLTIHKPGILNNVDDIAITIERGK